MEASTVVLGEIGCDVATPAMLEGAGLTGTAREAARHLAVTVPVTVRPARPKSELDLVVSARLHAPRGCPAPVACAPTPSVEYVDTQAATSANVSVTPGIGTVGGGLNRTTNRKELVSNVVGVGTRHVEWTIPGGRGPAAGSREFRFFVRQDQGELRHCWLEVTASVRVPRAFGGVAFLRRTPSESAPQRAWLPLVAESAPQAGATLVLLEERREDSGDGGSGDEGGGRADSGDQAARFYLGRPLDLPLAVTADGGPTVRSPRGEGAAVPVAGAFRWYDSVDGRPGFQWVQKSSERVELVDNETAGEGAVLRPGATVSVPDGSVLRFPDGRSLRVRYEGGPTAGRPTLKDALDVSVVVDDAVLTTHRTESGYVTIGRTLKDISINRPDISRTHGTLELSGDGWSYTHLSGVGDAVLRRGEEAVDVRRDTTVRVQRHDTVVLNKHVSLSIG
ncbi:MULTISPECIES: hypothetical protein [unclassified Streptomyces]|uniref:hypothetical protein n=1 Tax=unclassified Streptomyces TaxID=2593676 RepID=UPI00278BCC5A|nr:MULTISPECIES: hypothetical protein [unclassified Streptomyces]